jgi:hypothetical protein
MTNKGVGLELANDGKHVVLIIRSPEHKEPIMIGLDEESASDFLMSFFNNLQQIGKEVPRTEYPLNPPMPKLNESPKAKPVKSFDDFMHTVDATIEEAVAHIKKD